jgi:hypothetical protein
MQTELEKLDQLNLSLRGSVAYLAAERSLAGQRLARMTRQKQRLIAVVVKLRDGGELQGDTLKAARSFLKEVGVEL